MKIEICANSLQSALNAQAGGAHRIELCDNLLEGGTTPSGGVLKLVKQLLDIEVFVLIRPRGGDFCYNKWEFHSMLQDIEFAKQLGADGIVSGVLDKDQNLDLQRTIDLIEQSRPLPFTFHRAFDVVNRPMEVLEELINVGANRILTSGQAENALKGKALLSELIERAEGNITILAGGGINANNVLELAEIPGLREMHFSAKTARFEENGLPIYESEEEQIRRMVGFLKGIE